MDTQRNKKKSWVTTNEVEGRHPKTRDHELDSNRPRQTVWETTGRGLRSGVEKDGLLRRKVFCHLL